MPFQPFITITSRIVPLRIDHIDTDQIIPARFLKSVASTGFGDHLFHDWRYDAEGYPNRSFILNQPAGQGSILLAGRNFGCGSSREHAAWALLQYGFRVVISSGFADIFRNNALNVGLLPLEITIEELNSLFETTLRFPGSFWTIDLPNQIIRRSIVATNQSFHNDIQDDICFNINPFRKRCMVEGIDLVEFLVALRPEVEQFELNRAVEEAWI